MPTPTRMIFSNCKVFREAVREYCLLSGKHVTFTKNERVFENTQASSKWLRDKFLPRIQSNPTMPPQSIVNSASSEFKVGISMMKAYMAKAEAFRIIEGTVDEQYTMLWDYCHELEDKNSGSTTKMHYACHLKGIYGGQLLTVVGINPNNKTWVLAYDVVGMETRESWTWFIDLLAKDVDIVNSHGWAVISDKQKGLPGPFEDIVPNVETRFCVRHLYDNFNKTYKGNILRDQLWTYARATNVPSFNYQMELMKALDSNAWEWLAEKPPTQCKGQANYHNARDDQVLVDEKDPVEEGQDEQLASSIIKWDLSDIPYAHGIAAIHYK
ncbi:hypothetical protein L3X38_026559 [Prunus dulcis]|uniref:MULE transposase domain-containing protein n=1 Tax=Prunus dulcis TaxID=3755 RepID=A0AAD4VMH8_PRUDU|nr:hypothetical protein L3X38_026559 [Prunus dulcis]